MLALVLALLPSAFAQEATPTAAVNAQLLQLAVDGSYFRMSDSSMTADRTFSELMGKDASARYKFIMEHADEADELDL